MAAKKKSYSFANFASPVPDNWAERNFLLSIPEVMTITGESYSSLLDLVKANQLHPARMTKPYKFAPNEIMRFFFSPKETAIAPRQSKMRAVKNEQKAAGPKPKKESLWPR